ncbi:MAG TPA: hypothetical protein VGP73_18285 [Thermoanaerobaculia bacterium]
MLTKINLDGTDEDVSRWIWENLVPRSGPSPWLQGELLRAIERLRWEAQSNGNINWDEGFLMFVDFLGAHLLGEPQLSVGAKAEIRDDLDRLRNFIPVEELESDNEVDQLPYAEDDLYDRLVSQIVSYCRLHPELIAHQPDPAQFR